MSNLTYDVIIVGSGLSGIICATTILNKSKKINLKIISPEIGGDLQFFDDINYGPYFIRDDFQHVSTFFTKAEEITRSDFMFHQDKKSYTATINRGILKHLYSHIKFRKTLFHFHREIKNFREKCFIIPQNLALVSNSFLFDLYKKNGLDWIIENGLYDYYNDYLIYILQSISFATAKQMNAFHLLSLLSSFHIRTYRYIFNKKMFAPIEDYVLQDSVVDIKKYKNNYVIHTQNGHKITTKRVVLATPPHISSQFCNIKYNKPVSSFMFHLKGDIKEKFRAQRTNLFSTYYEISVVDKISNKENEYLLHAKVAEPPILDIFYNYLLINKKFWGNCFYWEGSDIVQFEQDDNFFVIGKHNIPLLEDVYIYATYAGNHILKLYETI